MITFTGVDEHTNLHDLARLWERYRRVEFAVLAGTHTLWTHRYGKTQGKPRFPSRATIAALAGVAAGLDTSAALHLCGQFSRQVNAGRYEDSVDLARGFTRVQVNAHEDDYDLDAIHGFAQALGPDRTVIVQYRGNVRPLPPDGLAFLVDRSGGRGIKDFANWPAPLGPRVGYAGGITPHNIGHAFETIETIKAALVDAPRSWIDSIWIDMETGVRDSSDRFDLARVANVCQQAWG